MRKILLGFFCIFLFLGAVSASDRIALIIGNSNYQQLGQLRNPVNDAQDLGAVLKQLGFSVTILLDADIDTMERSVAAFGRSLQADPDSTGFFFFAGHGVQSQGENYLIPVTGRIDDENQLKRKALAVGYILDTMNSAGNTLNLIFLDACRDNPFGWNRSGARGLSVVSNQPPGSIIVYATSAGSTAFDGTGRNGLFTGELLKHIATPALDITDMLKQVGSSVISASGQKQTPAVYNQFFGNFYLAGSPQNAATGGTVNTVSAAAVTGISPREIQDPASIIFLRGSFNRWGTLETVKLGDSVSRGIIRGIGNGPVSFKFGSIDWSISLGYRELHYDSERPFALPADTVAADPDGNISFPGRRGVKYAAYLDSASSSFWIEEHDENTGYVIYFKSVPGVIPQSYIWRKDARGNLTEFNGSFDRTGNMEAIGGDWYRSDLALLGLKPGTHIGVIFKDAAGNKLSGPKDLSTLYSAWCRMENGEPVWYDFKPEL